MHTTGQVYAFGASGISQLHGAYAQNIKQYDLYTKAIESGYFAGERSDERSTKEIIIRDTINQIMCNGELDFEKTAASYNITMEKYYEITQFDASKLEMMLADGLVEINNSTFASKITCLFITK